MSTPSKQRGALPVFLIPLLLKGLAAAIVLGAVWWVWSTWQDGRAAIKQVESAMDEMADCQSKRLGLVACVKEARAGLADCRDKHAVTLASLATQNDAVKGLEKERNAATKRAQEAERRAAALAAGNVAERERLAALILAGNPAGACPAGQAVATVRAGLKP